MKAFVFRFLEILFIALFITLGVLMTTSVFILRVVIGSEYPRRPVEGLLIGIALVMVAIKMVINRCGS